MLLGCWWLVLGAVEREGGGRGDLRGMMNSGWGFEVGRVDVAVLEGRGRFVEAWGW
jgi:hypothetical protein